jgi:hypothetical protein
MNRNLIASYQHQSVKVGQQDSSEEWNDVIENACNVLFNDDKSQAAGNRVLVKHAIISSVRSGNAGNTAPLRAIINYIDGRIDALGEEWIAMISQELPIETKIRDIVEMSKLFMSRIPHLAGICEIYQREQLVSLLYHRCYRLMGALSAVVELLKSLSYQRIGDCSKIVRQYESLIKARLRPVAEDFKEFGLREHKSERRIARTISTLPELIDQYQKWFNMVMTSRESEKADVYNSMVLLPYIQEHDIFSVYHWRYMAERFLKQTLRNVRIETDVVERIEGAHAKSTSTTRMRQMIADVSETADVLRHFHRCHIPLRSERYKHLKKPNFTLMNPTLMRNNFWPDPQDVTDPVWRLPVRYQVMIDAFEKFCEASYRRYKMKLQPSAGYAIASYMGAEETVYNIHMSMTQWAALSQFNETAVLTADQVSLASNVPIAKIAVILMGLYKHGLLQKTGGKLELKIKTDKFKANASFKNADRDFSIIGFLDTAQEAVMAAEASKLEPVKSELTTANKQSVLAMINKTMKARGRLPLERLWSYVQTKLREKFTIDREIFDVMLQQAVRAGVVEIIDGPSGEFAALELSDDEEGPEKKKSSATVELVSSPPEPVKIEVLPVAKAAPVDEPIPVNISKLLGLGKGGVMDRDSIVLMVESYIDDNKLEKKVGKASGTIQLRGAIRYALQTPPSKRSFQRSELRSLIDAVYGGPVKTAATTLPLPGLPLTATAPLLPVMAPLPVVKKKEPTPEILKEEKITVPSILVSLCGAASKMSLTDLTDFVLKKLGAGSNSLMAGQVKNLIGLDSPPYTFDVVQGLLAEMIGVMVPSKIAPVLLESDAELAKISATDDESGKVEKKEANDADNSSSSEEEDDNDLPYSPATKPVPSALRGLLELTKGAVSTPLALSKLVAQYIAANGMVGKKSTYNPTAELRDALQLKKAETLSAGNLSMIVGRLLKNAPAEPSSPSSPKKASSASVTPEPTALPLENNDDEVDNDEADDSPVIKKSTTSPKKASSIEPVPASLKTFLGLGEEDVPRNQIAQLVKNKLNSMVESSAIEAVGSSAWSTNAEVREAFDFDSDDSDDIYEDELEDLIDSLYMAEDVSSQSSDDEKNSDDEDEPESASSSEADDDADIVSEEQDSDDDPAPVKKKSAAKKSSSKKEEEEVEVEPADNYIPVSVKQYVGFGQFEGDEDIEDVCEILEDHLDNLAKQSQLAKNEKLGWYIDEDLIELFPDLEYGSILLRKELMAKLKAIWTPTEKSKKVSSSESEVDSGSEVEEKNSKKMSSKKAKLESSDYSSSSEDEEDVYVPQKLKDYLGDILDGDEDQSDVAEILTNILRDKGEDEDLKEVFDKMAKGKKANEVIGWKADKALATALNVKVGSTVYKSLISVLVEDVYYNNPALLNATKKKQADEQTENKSPAKTIVAKGAKVFSCELTKFLGLESTPVNATQLEEKLMKHLQENYDPLTDNDDESDGSESEDDDAPAKKKQAAVKSYYVDATLCKALEINNELETLLAKGIPQIVKNLFSKHAGPIYSDSEESESEYDGPKKKSKKVPSYLKKKSYNSSESESEDEAPVKKEKKLSPSSNSKSKAKELSVTEEFVHPQSVFEFIETYIDSNIQNIYDINDIYVVINHLQDYIEDSCKRVNVAKKGKPVKYILTSAIAKALGRATGDQVTLDEVATILKAMYEEMATTKKVEKVSSELIHPAGFLKMLKQYKVSTTAIKTIDDAVSKFEEFVDENCLLIGDKASKASIALNEVRKLFGLPPKKEILLSTLGPMLRALYEKLNKVASAEETIEPEQTIKIVVYIP